jgi:hypothetical protein
VEATPFIVSRFGLCVNQIDSHKGCADGGKVKTEQFYICQNFVTIGLRCKAKRSGRSDSFNRVSGGGGCPKAAVVSAVSIFLVVFLLMFATPYCCYCHHNRRLVCPVGQVTYSVVGTNITPLQFTFKHTLNDCP